MPNHCSSTFGSAWVRTLRQPDSRWALPQLRDYISFPNEGPKYLSSSRTRPYVYPSSMPTIFLTSCDAGLPPVLPYHPFDYVVDVLKLPRLIQRLRRFALSLPGGGTQIVDALINAIQRQTVVLWWSLRRDSMSRRISRGRRLTEAGIG